MSKTRTYSLWGIATDKYGAKHYVTVVGQRTQEKVTLQVAEKTQVTDENGKTRNATVLVDYPKTLRTFKMAKAICDPRDTFDEKYGIKLAESRIAHDDVIGTQTSFDATMLNDDQCEMLVLTEVRHICKHIDMYI